MDYWSPLPLLISSDQQKQLKEKRVKPSSFIEDSKERRDFKL